MHIVAFSGYSGVGKTTLIEQIIRHLRSAHLTVSVIKHAHHRFDIDHAGKDSHRLRSSGAFETLIANGNRMAMQREWAHGQNQWRPENDPALAARDLIAQMDRRVDWLILEGFRSADIPKIEVWRPELEKPAHYGDDPYIMALATNIQSHELPRPNKIPVLDLRQGAQIAQWLIQNASFFTDNN